MFEKTLQVTFSVPDEKTVTMNFKNPKANITQAEILAALTTIVQQQAFVKDGELFNGIKSARLVERFITNYEV